MKKLIIIFMTLCFINVIAFSQEGNEEKCEADNLLKYSLENDSEFRTKYNNLMEWIEDWIRNHPVNPQLHNNPVTIPVVVHVLYKNNSEKLSKAVVDSQIEALNRDFMMTNTSEISSKIPDEFKGLPVSSFIRFELAKRDPDGNPTNGYNLQATNKPYFIARNYQNGTYPREERTSQGVEPWDTDRYMNIWVCDIRNMSSSGVAGTSLLGYATFPEMNAPQGITITTSAFGTTGNHRTNSQYNDGRTATHEVGHYLGLRHIWGDGGCSIDDHVSDTPIQGNRNLGCPSHPTKSCSQNTQYTSDMFMNYMDYSDDACLYMFTAGQRARMLSHFAPGGKRASLATSTALFPPDAQDITYNEIYLEPSLSDQPSWKATCAMLNGWIYGECPDIDHLMSLTGGRSRNIDGLPQEIDQVSYACALDVREVNVCYPVATFYQLLQDGPIGIISVDDDEYYGLVVHGMVFDQRTGTALLKIKDPLNVGPRNIFAVNQSGSEYNISYNDFMIRSMEAAAEDGKRIFLVTPTLGQVN